MSNYLKANVISWYQNDTRVMGYKLAYPHRDKITIFLIDYIVPWEMCLSCDVTKCTTHWLADCTAPKNQ